MALLWLAQKPKMLRALALVLIAQLEVHEFHAVSLMRNHLWSKRILHLHPSIDHGIAR
jgi:hypothetical protein